MKSITLINSGLLMAKPMPPIGALILASILRENGYEVDFRDYQGKYLKNRCSISTFESFCETTSDIIGFSTFCTSLPTVLGTIKRIKEKNPEKIIILGGPGSNDVAQHIMEHFPVDFIVVGEGEYTLLELLEAIYGRQGYDNIKGLVYRGENGVVFTGHRQRIQNLGAIPIPAYDLINLEEYDDVAGLLTSRGCPFRCAFCAANSIWHRQITYRPIQDIIEEAKILAKYKNVIGFVDDTFVLDLERAKTIVKGLRDVGIHHPLSCNGKITLMNDEWLQFLSENHFIQVFYGVESGSNRILNIISKGHTIGEARKVIKQTTQYIENVRTSYIWGYPFETMDEFLDLVDVLYDDMKIRGVTSQMSLLSPLPSSKIYSEYKDCIKFDPYVQSRAGGLPVEENLLDYPELIDLIDCYPQIFSSFYYYDHQSFNNKFNIIKKIDWIYDDVKLKEYTESVLRVGGAK